MSLPLYSTIFPPNFSFSTPSTLIWTPPWQQQPLPSTSFYQHLQGYYMSQSIFTYTPELFGHPHQTPEPQPTEPFRNQYPKWANPEQPVDNTSIYHQPIRYPKTAAMDVETVHIGAKTKNGRQLTKPNGRGKVDVWANGIFIKEMPIGVLCRFSKVAAATFPRPEVKDKAVNGNANGVKGSEATEKNGPTNWADDDGDAQKAATELAKLNTNPAPKVNTTANAGKKELNLYLDKLYLQPPVEAFNFAFQWMDRAKDTPRGEKVVDYGVEYPERITLENLVDIYAVALVLDIRPAINKHRVHVMNKMTEQRPTLATLVYVHEHLPIDDVAMTRFITSYFEHRERSEYTVGEIEKIEDYVCTEDRVLHARFTDIGKARDQKRKQDEDTVRRNRELRIQAELQRAAESLGNGNVESGGAVFVGAGNGDDQQSGNGPRGGGKTKKQGQQNGGLKKNGVGSDVAQ